MQSGRDITGRCASPGLFVGDVFLATPPEDHYAGGDRPGVEQARLDQSVATAIAELTALAADKDSQSTAILEFQIEMLMDPEILEEANKCLKQGQGAELAWVTAMDRYVTSFQTSDDEAVRARAADMTDIRNRVLAALAGRPFVDFPAGSVYAAQDMEPSLFLMHDWSHGGAIVLSAGSTSSHVAMLARARSIPMLVATGPLRVAIGARLLVDANSGRVSLYDGDGTTEDNGFGSPNALPAIATDNDDGRVRLGDGRSLSISVNINDLGEMSLVDPGAVAGVGLVRSEFLLRSAADLADEERHHALYRAVLDWAGDKPVTIRLLDLGGDKPVAGTGPSGGNGHSMLGLRGIRFLLARPEIMRIQARAILRAGAGGRVRVLVPMVTVRAEIEATRRIFEEEARALAHRGINVEMPPIGMMVEVPAAALMLETFGIADFFSLGTNDLAQYIAAAGRDNDSVQPLIDSTMPALLRMIAMVAESAQRMGKDLSICGDLAGDPDRLADLTGIGLLQFSVAPSRIKPLKSAVGMQVAGQNRKDG